jgi:hypothetical protein
LGQSLSSAAIELELRRAQLERRGRLPDSLLLYPLTEWRSYEEFLPAHSWHEGRQSRFDAASMSSTSSRCWRWRRGDISAPSGSVPGSGDAGSPPKMVFGPNCVFIFPFRVLLAKFRDWSVILCYLCPLLGCTLIFDLI